MFLIILIKSLIIGGLVGVGSLLGALLFYIWQKPITGGAILGAMILGSIFPIAIS